MLPFSIQVYNGHYLSRGPLGAPKSLSGRQAFNAPGSAEFEVAADHPRVPDLNTPGARVVIHHATAVGPIFLLSGRVEQVDGGGGAQPWRRYQVIDDFTVLTDETQCWPKPSSAITSQGGDGAYFVRTGPAETVLKQVLAPNIARQGTNLTIPTTAGLGATITASLRFHTPAERVLPLVDAAGLGVQVRQEGATRILDVWEPQAYPQVLTQGSGVVRSGEYSVKAPLVTRVVCGAGGEGEARAFREFPDAAREATWGIVLPAFRDARDVPAGDPNLATILQARAEETLTEGAPTASLKCELVETDHFSLGVAYNIGDIVTVKLTGDAPLITDRVRFIDFDWTKDEGAVITPRIGEWSDSSDEAVVKRVLALTRAVSDLEKGR